MKLRKLIVFSLLATGLMASAAITRPKIDLTGIRVEVTMNPSAYRALLDRFIEGDQSLTADEMAKIYYGYTSTYDYNPTLTYGEIDKAFKENDFKRVIELGVPALERNPLSLDLTAKVLVSATSLPTGRDQLLIDNLQQRYNRLTEIILLSGKGVDPNSPIIVISESDMLALLHNVLLVTEITERGNLGTLEVVKAKSPGSKRELVLFFNNTLQDLYETSNN